MTSQLLPNDRGLASEAVEKSLLRFAFVVQYSVLLPLRNAPQPRERAARSLGWGAFLNGMSSLILH